MLRDLTIILLCSLLWGVVIWGCHRGETNTTTQSRDTVRIVRIDTVRITKPVAESSRQLSDAIEVRVVDTIFMVDTIYRERLIYLPRQQRYYNEEGLYDLWVSGVEPELDSVRVYHRSEVATINNPARWSLYGSVRFGSGGNPSVGLFITTRGRFACGVDVGGFVAGEPTYGVSLAYRLF